MKTISISDNTHEQLLKISGELQRQTGQRADFDTAIKALLEKWKK